MFLSANTHFKIPYLDILLKLFKDKYIKDKWAFHRLKLYAKKYLDNLISSKLKLSLSIYGTLFGTLNLKLLLSIF